MTGKQKLVEFRVNGESYGVDIDLVKEILSAWTIIPVTTLQEKISGVIFLRGDDIPVINTRCLLGMTGSGDDNPGQRIIIIGMKTSMGRSFGLLVDSVCSIIELIDQNGRKMNHPKNHFPNPLRRDHSVGEYW